MLQWFIRFAEFSEFLFHVGKTSVTQRIWAILEIVNWGGRCKSIPLNRVSRDTTLINMHDASKSWPPTKDGETKVKAICKAIASNIILCSLGASYVTTETHILKATHHVLFHRATVSRN